MATTASAIEGKPSQMAESQHLRVAGEARLLSTRIRRLGNGDLDRMDVINRPVRNP